MIFRVPAGIGTEIPVRRDIGLPSLACVRYQRASADLLSGMNRGAPMTATAVFPHAVPRVRVRSVAPAPTSRAVAYQRVLHQLVRRELRLLADLSTWAPAGESGRTQGLTRHAELIGRVMLHHHRVERDLLWPALQRALPDDDELSGRIADWTARCAYIDHK